MVNTYRLKIRSACPVHDGQTDCYTVTVTSESIIPVESILEFFQQCATTKIYQEELAQRAATAIGAEVEIVGIHSGVTVKSVAP